MSTIRIRACSPDLAHLVANHLASAGHATSCAASTGAVPSPPASIRSASRSS